MLIGRLIARNGSAQSKEALVGKSTRRAEQPVPVDLVRPASSPTVASNELECHPKVTSRANTSSPASSNQFRSLRATLAANRANTAQGLATIDLLVAPMDLTSEELSRWLMRGGGAERGAEISEASSPTTVSAESFSSFPEENEALKECRADVQRENGNEARVVKADDAGRVSSHALREGSKASSSSLGLHQRTSCFSRGTSSISTLNFDLDPTPVSTRYPATIPPMRLPRSTPRSSPASSVASMSSSSGSQSNKPVGTTKPTSKATHDGPQLLPFGFTAHEATGTARRKGESDQSLIAPEFHSLLSNVWEPERIRMRSEEAHVLARESQASETGLAPSHERVEFPFKVASSLHLPQQPQGLRLRSDPSSEIVSRKDWPGTANDAGRWTAPPEASKLAFKKKRSSIPFPACPDVASSPRSSLVMPLILESSMGMRALGNDIREELALSPSSAQSTAVAHPTSDRSSLQHPFERHSPPTESSAAVSRFIELSTPRSSLLLDLDSTLVGNPAEDANDKVDMRLLPPSDRSHFADASRSAVWLCIESLLSILDNRAMHPFLLDLVSRQIAAFMWLADDSLLGARVLIKLSQSTEQWTLHREQLREDILKMRLLKGGRPERSPFLVEARAALAEYLGLSTQHAGPFPLITKASKAISKRMWTRRLQNMVNKTTRHTSPPGLNPQSMDQKAQRLSDLVAVLLDKGRNLNSRKLPMVSKEDAKELMHQIVVLLALGDTMHSFQPKWTDLSILRMMLEARKAKFSPRLLLVISASIQAYYAMKLPSAKLLPRHPNVVEAFGAILDLKSTALNAGAASLLHNMFA
ncbi:hypothetical protein K437DRAFT_165581 [Tilletiaria anomala UBC 951]|uniref:Uncharacterized protein n=1 Tax=Tilletiaria anomala (strain ATCC 24038 / CBS 436.72 / UBC 951) TaxID=1037660 RepID=A0A066VU29_TILAU|nr:uncharacterized protein K437DRAFT_165581 [Tilletiaria anomala UBC 951]KDN42304.1 hypothetical protein K437DRAFT_165581 [Tilletiaria anomala UBC 951]